MGGWVGWWVGQRHFSVILGRDLAEPPMVALAEPPAAAPAEHPAAALAEPLLNFLKSSPHLFFPKSVPTQIYRETIRLKPVFQPPQIYTSSKGFLSGVAMDCGPFSHLHV